MGKKERPIKKLYLSVSPTGVVRSGNDQELKICEEIDTTKHYVTLKQVDRVIKKNEVIPFGSFIDTGNGDIYLLSITDDEEILVYNIYTYPKVERMAKKSITTPGLYAIESDEDEPIKLKNWKYDSQMKLFRVYWNDERVEELKGLSIGDAIIRNGYAPETVRNIRLFEEI